MEMGEANVRGLSSDQLEMDNKGQNLSSEDFEIARQVIEEIVEQIIIDAERIIQQSETSMEKTTLEEMKERSEITEETIISDVVINQGGERDARDIPVPGTSQREQEMEVPEEQPTPAAERSTPTEEGIPSLAVTDESNGTDQTTFEVDRSEVNEEELSIDESDQLVSVDVEIKRFEAGVDQTVPSEFVQKTTLCCASANFAVENNRTIIQPVFPSSTTGTERKEPAPKRRRVLKEVQKILNKSRKSGKSKKSILSNKKSSDKENEHQLRFVPSAECIVNFDNKENENGHHQEAAASSQSFRSRNEPENTQEADNHLLQRFHAPISLQPDPRLRVGLSKKIRVPHLHPVLRPSNRYDDDHTFN